MNKNIKLILFITAVILVIVLIAIEFLPNIYAGKLIASEHDAEVYADSIMPLFFGETVVRQKPWSITSKMGGLFYRISGYHEAMMGYPASILVRARDGKILWVYNQFH